MARRRSPFRISFDMKSDLETALRMSLEEQSEWAVLAYPTGFSDSEKKTMNDIVEPVKLVITRNAFDRLKVEDSSKSKSLLQIKAQACRVEWGTAQITSKNPTEVVFYFDPKVFEEIVREYPWVLDKDLGVKDEIYPLWKP